MYTKKTNIKHTKLIYKLQTKTKLIKTQNADKKTNQNKTTKHKTPKKLLKTKTHIKNNNNNKNPSN